MRDKDLGNNRSNLDFDLSNIQYAGKNDSSNDASTMKAKTDAIDHATSAKKSRQDVSGLHKVDISDVTDVHALRNNYLEKSQNDG